MSFPSPVGRWVSGAIWSVAWNIVLLDCIITSHLDPEQVLQLDL